MPRPTTATATRSSTGALVMSPPPGSAVLFVGGHRCGGFVKVFVGLASGVGLAWPLGHRPSASPAVDGDGCPPGAVFVAEMDEQCGVVMLDTETVGRVGLLMKPADNTAPRGVPGDERRPSAPTWLRACDSAIAGVVVLGAHALAAHHYHQPFMTPGAD